MKVLVLGRTAIATPAVLLVLQATPVAAAPVSVWALMGEVLHGYNAVVEIRLDPPPTGAPSNVDAKPLVVQSIELVGKGEPSKSLKLPVADDKVAETDIAAAIDWLAPLPSEIRVETLSALMYYTKPSDPDKVNAFLEKLGLIQFDVGDQQVGFFTSAGKQVSEIEGGTDASAGQVLDAMTEAVVSLVAADAEDDQSLDEIATLSSGDFAALDQFVQATPVERKFSDAPPLSSGDGSASRPRLLKNVVAGVEAAVQVKRGLFRDQKLLTLDDLGKAFKEAGLEVDMRLNDQNELVVFTTEGGVAQDVLLSGLKVEMQSQGGKTSWYLDTSAYGALRDQLGKEVLGPDFEETYETLGRFEEIDFTVSTLEEELAGGGDPTGPDPNGPQEPGSNGDGR